MRPVRRPDLRRARLRRHRHRRQGRPARAGPAQGLRAARPRLRSLPHGRGGARGRRPDRRRAPAARARAHRDQVPARRGAPFRRDRPSGRDRRGQGLGRAGAAHRARRRDRRPDRHRHDAGGERPARDGGDRGLHGAPDRQPGRAQAEGGRRSTRSWRECGRREDQAQSWGPRAPSSAPGSRTRCAPSSRRSPSRAMWPCAGSAGASTESTSASCGLRARRSRLPLSCVDPGVLAGLRTAIANVRALVEAQLREPVTVELAQGQHIEIAELPVRRAAIYVPGGRAPYPSTVVMGAVTARAAGVDEVVVCTPPGPDGGVNAVILAACALCEVDEVYRMGGAQAIARARLRHELRGRRRRDRRPRERLGPAGEEAGRLDRGRDRRHRWTRASCS